MSRLKRAKLTTRQRRKALADARENVRRLQWKLSTMQGWGFKAKVLQGELEQAQKRLDALRR